MTYITRITATEQYRSEYQYHLVPELVGFNVLVTTISASPIRTTVILLTAHVTGI